MRIFSSYNTTACLWSKPMVAYKFNFCKNWNFDQETVDSRGSLHLITVRWWEGGKARFWRGKLYCLSLFFPSLLFPCLPHSLVSAIRLLLLLHRLASLHANAFFRPLVKVANYFTALRLVWHSAVSSGRSIEQACWPHLCVVSCDVCVCMCVWVSTSAKRQAAKHTQTHQHTHTPTHTRAVELARSSLVPVEGWRVGAIAWASH